MTTVRAVRAVTAVRSVAAVSHEQKLTFPLVASQGAGGSGA